MAASFLTPPSSDLTELAELLPDLPVSVLIVTPRQWGDDCGYCPGPEDTVADTPRHASAFIAYEAPDLFHPTTSWDYRDAVCPGCLPVALAQLRRRYPLVWVEVPTTDLCWCCYQPVCGDVCTHCGRPKIFCACPKVA